MNWKATALLIVGVIVVGIVAYVNPFEGDEEAKDKSPWFYQVSYDDITSIRVSTGENAESFHRNDEEVWVFDGPLGIPPSKTRWGGIVLLVSGPKTQRDFSEVRATIDDPAEYGLENPGLIVDVGLTAGRNIQFVLGNTTTDGDWNYGTVTGFPQLFLIADSWGKVLARLADDPPIPKWFIKRDPASIEEVNVYLGDPATPDAPLLTLQQDDGEWTARNRPEDEAPRPLDPERWADFSHLMVGPQNITVENARVVGNDYTPWGIELEGHSIEIRFMGQTERGTSFTDGVLFSIGDKSPDGTYYYAMPASDQYSTPVLRLDAEWTDAMFNLFDNLPYSDEDTSKEAG